MSVQVLPLRSVHAEGTDVAEGFLEERLGAQVGLVVQRVPDKGDSGMLGQLGQGTAQELLLLGLGVDAVAAKAELRHDQRQLGGHGGDFLTDDLTLYADYQFATFEDDTGRLTVHRFYVGADQTVTEGLYARLGTAVDTEGNVSLAAGLGIAPSETVYIDIAYQYDVFPELEPEFGRADLFSIGLTVLF